MLNRCNHWSVINQRTKQFKMKMSKARIFQKFNTFQFIKEMWRELGLNMEHIIWSDRKGSASWQFYSYCCFVFSEKKSEERGTQWHTLLSNSLSSVQIMHSNVQIASTNIQRYCTVQNRIFNRFGETGNHPTWQLLNKLLFIQFKELIGRLFFNQSKYSTSLVTTCHAAHLASFLFVQICLQNSL